MNMRHMWAFAVILVACGPSPKPDGGSQCSMSSDCLNGEVCDVATGVCQQPADAGNDAGVDAGMPSDGGCVPPLDGGYVAPDGGTKPTFSSIYSTIIDGPPGCGLCHESSAEGGLIMLSKPGTYAGLVDQPVQSAAWAGTGYTMRVVPGDPAHSALVAALQHSASIPMALYMPQANQGAPVTQQQIDAVIGWIQACAPND